MNQTDKLPVEKSRSVSRGSKIRKTGAPMTPLSHFGVAVVDPEFGLNLGYIARTMANFGMSDLVVVSPTENLEDGKFSQALLYAAHARSVIERISYVKSIDELREQFSLTIGTTAIEARRKSNLTRRTLDVEECAVKIKQTEFDRSRRPCFVFGRDTTGLTNEELRKCDYSLTIRTRSNYNTLNVSHAAAIVFYVFSRDLSQQKTGAEKQNKNAVAGKEKSEPGPSSRAERDRAVALFEKLARQAEFQEFKAGLLSEALNRLFNRGDPSLREIYLLMGLASKASSKIERLASASS